MQRHTHPRYRCRGVAIVEFVLVAPFLLLLMLGIAEFGRLLYQYNTLTKAVREGARYAAESAPGLADVLVLTQKLRTETANMVVYGIPIGGGSALVPGLATTDVLVATVGTDSLSVSATYRYLPAVAQALPGFGYGADIPLALTLSASTTIRLL